MKNPQLTAASWVGYVFLTASDKDLSETGEKILSFGELEKGWHFGEGSSPSDSSIKKALELDGLAQELGFTNTDAFPGPNGELRYCVYEGANYYEFTFEIDGSVTAVIENDENEIECASSLEKARSILKQFSIWNISDSFIGDIGTSKERISKVWPFRTHPRADQFPLLTESAQNDMSVASALGLTNSTENTPRVLQYGFLTQNYSPKKQSSQASQAIRETSAIATCAA